MDPETIVEWAKATRSEVPTGRPEVVVERVFDARRETVFAMWSDSAELDQWWGPVGFSNETHAFDFREGGAWTYTMHGPDGTDYPNHITWLEIVPPERLVYDQGTDAAHPALFHVTVTFRESGDQTTIQMRLVFPTIEQRDTVVSQYGAVQGGKETLARLALHLAAKQTPSA